MVRVPKTTTATSSWAPGPGSLERGAQHGNAISGVTCVVVSAKSSSRNGTPKPRTHEM